MPSVLSRRAFLGTTAAVGLGVAAGGAITSAASASTATGRLACWGDSLTQGAGGGNVRTNSYPAVLFRLADGYYGTLADPRVYNGGRGGERSGAIAARQGGTPARVAEPVTIPASGSVALELQDEVFFTGEQPVFGTLKGVDGSMTRIRRFTHAFTRTDPGAEVEVPIGAKFFPDDGRDQKRADTIIWAGHNDNYVRDRPGGDVPTIQAHVAAMVSYKQAAIINPSHYLVLSLINGEGGGNGFGPPAGPPTTFYTRAILEVNADLQSVYGPDNYLDVHRYLVDQALADSGLPVTDQDRNDMDNDIPPASLRATRSAGHLNETGYEMLAEHIFAFIVARGWVPQA